MPQAFENCVSGGGNVITKELSGGKYMHICYKNGKAYAGEVKTKKGVSKKKEAKEKDE